MILQDGAIDKEAYSGATVKVVHLLKQGVTEQNPEGNKSLGDMIKKAAKKESSMDRMWKVCARRSYSIANGFPLWDKIEKLKFGDDLWPAFLCNAVVNLIKDTGASRTSDMELEKRVQEYRQSVEEQLKNLKPHVIICGGTFNAWLKDCSQTVTSPSGMKWVKMGNTYFLDAYHPSHQVKHSLEYTWFRNCAIEILGKDFPHIVEPPHHYARPFRKKSSACELFIRNNLSRRHQMTLSGVHWL